MKTLLFIAAGLLASSAFAVYGPTGSLTLSGTIAEINELEVHPEAVASNLVLATTQSNLLVAKVAERSNSIDGYNITMSSANGNKLKNGVAKVAYTLTYGASATVHSLLVGQAVKTTATFGFVEDLSDVKISYVGSATLPAGTYSDTITVSISAN